MSTVKIFTDNGMPCKQVDNGAIITIFSVQHLYATPNKVIIRYNGGDGDIFAKDTLQISGATVSGTLEEKAQALRNYFKDFFVEAPGAGGAEITYKHPSGDSEYVGSGNYSQNGLGLYIPPQEKEYQFNQLKAKVARETSYGELFVSIFLATGNLSSNITPSSLTQAIPQFSIQTNTLPETKTIDVPDIITVPVGYNVVVCFYTKSAERVTLRYWNTDVADRLLFYLCVSSNNGTILNDTWGKSGGSYLGVPLIAVLDKNYATKNYVNSVMPTPFTKLSFTKNIAVAQGRELNIWKALSRQDLLFNSTVGEHKERSYRLAAGSVANTALNIIETGVNKSYNSSLALKVVSSSTAVTGKQILVIGDSLIAANTTVEELSTLLSGNGTNRFLGTQGNTVKHEGRGGWTFADYTTSGGGSNPFWDGTKINFKNYMSTNSNFGGTDTIDVCYIQLGINDIYGNIALATIIANAKLLIAALRTDYPACKIILGIPPISCDQDGFGANYGAAKNMLDFENAMKSYWSEAISQFDESRYNSAVSVCQSGLWVDRNYGYQTASVAISARVATTVNQHSNALHPNVSGYQQIADAVYSHILSLYAA